MEDIKVLQPDEEAETIKDDIEPSHQLDIITIPEIIEKMVFPNSSMYIAKKFGGKSNLLLNIYDKKAKKGFKKFGKGKMKQFKRFDNNILVTLSNHTGNLKKISDKENTMKNITDDIIENIIDFQNDNVNSKTNIIFDDFIDSEQTLRRIPKIYQLATSGRNSNISLAVSSQDHASIPNKLRKNCEHIFIGKNLRNSAEAISKDLGTKDVPPKMLMELILNIRDHSFLYYSDFENKWYFLPEKNIKLLIE